MLRCQWVERGISEAEAGAGAGAGAGARTATAASRAAAAVSTAATTAAAGESGVDDVAAEFRRVEETSGFFEGLMRHEGYPEAFIS